MSLGRSSTGSERAGPRDRASVPASNSKRRSHDEQERRSRYFWDGPAAEEPEVEYDIHAEGQEGRKQPDVHNQSPQKHPGPSGLDGMICQTSAASFHRSRSKYGAHSGPPGRRLPTVQSPSKTEVRRYAPGSRSGVLDLSKSQPAGSGWRERENDSGMGLDNHIHSSAASDIVQSYRGVLELLDPAARYFILPISESEPN